VPLHWLL